MMSLLPLPLHKLAEVLSISNLHDQAIDTICEFDWRGHYLPSLEEILDGYTESSKARGLRRYLAHCFAYVTVQGNIYSK